MTSQSTLQPPAQFDDALCILNSNLDVRNNKTLVTSQSVKNELDKAIKAIKSHAKKLQQHLDPSKVKILTNKISQVIKIIEKEEEKLSLWEKIKDRAANASDFFVSSSELTKRVRDDLLLPPEKILKGFFEGPNAYQALIPPGIKKTLAKLKPDQVKSLVANQIHIRPKGFFDLEQLFQCDNLEVGFYAILKCLSTKKAKVAFVEELSSQLNKNADLSSYQSFSRLLKNLEEISFRQRSNREKEETFISEVLTLVPKTVRDGFLDEISLIMKYNYPCPIHPRSRVTDYFAEHLARSYLQAKAFPEFLMLLSQNVSERPFCVKKVLKEILSGKLSPLVLNPKEVEKIRKWMS